MESAREVKELCKMKAISVGVSLITKKKKKQLSTIEEIQILMNVCHLISSDNQSKPDENICKCMEINKRKVENRSSLQPCQN